MSIPFTSYMYIEPPRPENVVMPGSLGKYEKLKWVAQVKKNGTRSVVFVPPKGQEPFAKTRHPEDPEHKAWPGFSAKSVHQFKKMQDDKWHVFDTELMHSKGFGIRDTHYIHDVLVFEGVYLLGKSMIERQEILHECFDVKKHQQTQSHYVIDSNTWVARNHRMGFRKLFDNLKEEDEGLVLKNPRGLLTTRHNSYWMAKCRRAHENFGF